MLRWLEWYFPYNDLFYGLFEKNIWIMDIVYQAKMWYIDDVDPKNDNVKMVKIIRYETND